MFELRAKTKWYWPPGKWFYGPAPLPSGISWAFDPPTPLEFPIPSVVGVWIFSRTTQYSGQLLNLLELRSITGCPGGTCSVFTRAFRAKRELHCKFLGKKKIIITSKHGTTIFFSHYNLFLRKLTEKLARKAHVNTEWVYWIVLMPLGHHIILYSLNLSNPTWLPYR